ncbi:hypothetical protein FHR81_000566 [Actinoalloteichus hoggarensis]|uniref:Uncharacterized protein n=1 Tax=Actinoalloteichus hoggarensis TaxID=1470176 RepID=A0A221W1W2_9PSEU|nr:hypothetical protein AHOG_10565 [Actinoalloteichus hoggarensis]MBB5919537.1 hypothetical protein [Actinoalloteichus hoggarensis]
MTNISPEVTALITDLWPVTISTRSVISEGGVPGGPVQTDRSVLVGARPSRGAIIRPTSPRDTDATEGGSPRPGPRSTRARRADVAPCEIGHEDQPCLPDADAAGIQ